MGENTGETLFTGPKLLPGKVKWGGYVYVLLFQNARVKVGKTAHPRRRMESHRSGGEAYGTRIARGWLSPWHKNVDENETALIGRASGLGGTTIKNEYFSGINFDKLVSHARRLTFQPVDVEAEKACDRELAEAATTFVEDLHEGLKQGTGSTSDIDPASQYFRDVAGKWFGRDGENYRPRPADRSPLPMSMSMSMSIVVKLAEVRECSVDEILDMNYIDMVKIGLIAMVETEASLAKIHALENGRNDLLMTIGESLAEAASQQGSGTAV